MIDGNSPSPLQEVMRYTNALGEYIDLNVGVSGYGRMIPPVQVYEDSAPAQPGSMLVDTQYQPRILNLYLSVPAVGQRDLMRKMARVLNPRLGLGTLQPTQGAGADRYLECIYIGGLESIVEDNPNYSYGIVQFKAFNPFWISTAPQNYSFTSVTTVAYNWFGYGGTNTWFPFNMGSGSGITVQQTINNIGDVEVWPYMVVTGPGGPFTVTNVSTGAVFTVNGILANNEVMNIDMTYGKKTVTKTDAMGITTNWYNLIADTTDMWYLEPGNNLLSIQYTTTSGTVQIGYLPQYLSA